MAAKIGSLDELEPASESVSNYVERVEMYFEVNDIAAAKQVSTLPWVRRPMGIGVNMSLEKAACNIGAF